MLLRCESPFSINYNLHKLPPELYRSNDLSKAPWRGENMTFAVRCCFVIISCVKLEWCLRGSGAVGGEYAKHEPKMAENSDAVIARDII